MTGDLEAGTLGGSGSPLWRRAASPRPPFRGGPLPGYAAALSGLSDAELHRLLERRPDLLSPPAPASFPELAGRAGTPASLAAALRTLDLGALRLAELLAVVGLPTTVPALAEAAGPGLDPARLEAGLATLAELGIALPGPDGTISGPPALGAPFGRPGGLGPPVAELAKVGVSAERLERILANLGAPRPPGTGKAALVRAVSAALADPATVARAAAEADQDARRLLDEALATAGPITVMGVGYGRFAGYPDAEPASWLLERGLLLPVTYSQLVVPREAALGLRGGLVFPEWPRPPAAEPVDPLPDGPARAAAAATRAVIAAEGICARLDREPLPLVRAGTVAVRDLGRLARDLDLADQELALLVDLLVEAGVLAVGGPFGQRSLGLRPEADAWLSAARSRRWADLAAAWRSADLAVEDHLVRRPRPTPPAAARPASPAPCLALSPADRAPSAWPSPPPSAAPRLARPGPHAAARGASPGRRHRGAGPGARLAGADGVAGPGGERAGRAGGDGPGDAGRGRLPRGGRGRGGAGPGRAGRRAAGWRGMGPRALAEVAEAALPDGPDRFLLAGDLTVVAPGGLAPGVETRLAGLADREAAGSGTWRIHDASLRRAFDEGHTAEDVLEFLRRHSSTPLSQALEYLVADVARRHGRLRVGGATTYLRGDPAMVAGAVRSAAGRRLGLRELGPGRGRHRSQPARAAGRPAQGRGGPPGRGARRQPSPRGAPPRPPRAAGRPRPPGPGRGRPQRPRRRPARDGPGRRGRPASGAGDRSRPPAPTSGWRVADGALIVQSDRSVLLEVDHPKADAARAAIAPFAELEKSPEHVHTYRLTPLALWNARAAGLTPAQVTEALREHSRYPVPPGLLTDLVETMGRYGRLVLRAGDDGLVLDHLRPGRARGGGPLPQGRARTSASGSDPTGSRCRWPSGAGSSRRCSPSAGPPTTRPATSRAPRCRSSCWPPTPAPASRSGSAATSASRSPPSPPPGRA